MVKDTEGTKMIKLCIYFHTKQGDFQLPQKMAFERGGVTMPTNHKHGIRASDSIPIYFGKGQNTLMEAIKKCLKAYGVKLVREDKVNEFKQFLKTKGEEEFVDKEMNI